MNDLPLFASARRTDPETSHAAARRAPVKTLSALVLEALGVRPMTSKEVAHHVDREHVAISPRFRPLERRGLIRPTGEVREGSRVWAKNAEHH